MRHPGLAITRFAIKVSPNGAIQHGAKSIMAFIVDLTALGIAHKGAIFHMGADIILWTAGNLLEAGLLLVAKHLTHTTVAPSGIIQIRALDESPTISWVTPTFRAIKRFNLLARPLIKRPSIRKTTPLILSPSTKGGRGQDAWQRQTINLNFCWRRGKLFNCARKLRWKSINFRKAAH